MNQKILSVIALLLALTVLLISCGGLTDAETTAGTPDTTAEPQGTTGADGTTSADDPDVTTEEPADPIGTTEDESTAEPTVTEGETTKGETDASTTPPATTETDAATTPAPKGPKYLSLGDSIANGYGLADAEDERYSALVKKGMRYSLMKSECKDGQTSSALLTAVNGLTLEGEGTELITVSTGANNILGPASARLFQLILDPDAGLAVLNSPEFDAELRAGVAQLREDLPKIVARLKELAPDAKIVLLSIYNPYDGVKVSVNASTGATDVMLGEMTETYIGLLNEVIADVAEETGCIVADVYTAFREADEQVVNVTTDANGYMTTSYDPHPNAKGHEIIADVILKALQDA